MAHSRLKPSKNLSVESIKLIDDMCDLFEAAFGSEDPVSISSLVDKAPPHVARLLEHELRAIEKELLGDMPAPKPAQIEGFELKREIARGGMGVVLEARDIRFDRDLAVKLMLDVDSVGNHARQRFNREAMITGQLQHPGIPPAHAVGETSDGQPFFAMKLIEGQTLRAILKSRTTQAVDLPRLIAVFESIAQTVAFAHSRGVIHRDLKPSNVMVGRYGEVQVMDWGLAKRVDAPDDSSEFTPPGLDPTGEEETVAWPAASTGDGQTLPGSVLGTPAYMSPEQARGELESVSAASDVFGLGAILCEILTGNPPFSKLDPGQAFEAARQGDTSEARAAIMASGADSALVDLTLQCLEVDPENRPAAADVVAESIKQYRDSQAERARQAEVNEARTRVRFEEQRKRLRLWVSLGGLAALLVIGAFAVTLWYQHMEAEKARVAAVAAQRDSARGERITAAVEAALDEFDRDLADLHEKFNDPRKMADLMSSIQDWEAEVDQLNDSIQRAVKVVTADPSLISPSLSARLEAARKALAVEINDFQMAADFDQLHLLTLAAGTETLAGYHRTTNIYRTTLARHNLDPDQPKQMVEEARRSRISVCIVAALDRWALLELKRFRIKDSAPSKDLVFEVLGKVKHLHDIANEIDPDPWRVRVRDVQKWVFRREELTALAEEVDIEAQSPHLLDVFATVLMGDAEIVLRHRALMIRPGDFYMCHNLAMALTPRPDAISWFNAALVARPRSALAWNNLAAVVAAVVSDEQSLYATGRALAIEPTYFYALHSRAATLGRMGRLDEAIHYFRLALEQDAHHPTTHLELGIALYDHGEREAGLDSMKRALEIDAEFFRAHVVLGNTYRSEDNWQLALKHYASAIETQPELLPVIRKACLAKIAELKRDGNDAEAELMTEIVDSWGEPPE